MAAVSVFDTLRKRVEASDGLLPQERRAMYWFRNYGNQLQEWQNTTNKQTFSSISSQAFAKRLVPPKAVFPGYLYFYMYAPLGASSLDYYDRMPFTLVLDRDAEGFLGLNFHYLPYRMRAILFDALYGNRFVKNRDPLKARINVTYKILNGVTKYKLFRPCLKRYLYKRVRTPLLQVGETEWDIALFLPVERFAKATRMEIWNDTAQMISDIDADEGFE
jgi:hypothetical protein